MAQKLTYLLISLVLMGICKPSSPVSSSNMNTAALLLNTAYDYISRARDLNPACFNYEYHRKKQEITASLLETATNLISVAKNVLDKVDDDVENPDCEIDQSCSSILDDITNLISEAKKSCFKSSAKQEKSKQVSNQKKVVCYLSSWSHYRTGDGKFNITHIPPHMCTHIIYAFAKLENNTIIAADPNVDLQHDGYKTLKGLKDGDPDLKTLIGIGGGNVGASSYSRMAADPARRGTFVGSVVPFLKSYGFDGMDINWAYPGDNNGGRPEDKENYVLLLRELKAALNQHGLLLSASVPVRKYQIDKGFDIPAISKELDQMNLLTYDFHTSRDRVTGMNSPLYASTNASQEDQMLTIDFAVDYWLKNGAPKEKLVLGQGLYGRSFTLVDESQHGVHAPAKDPGEMGPWSGEAGTLIFNEICIKLTKENWTSAFDSDTGTPYAFNGNQWVSYDDRKSLSIKMDYLLKKGLAGVMLWSIDMDDFRGTCYGSKWYLLSTVAKTLMH